MKPIRKSADSKTRIAETLNGVSKRKQAVLI